MIKRFAPKLALLALVVTGIVLALTYREQLSPDKLEALIAVLGVWAPLAYIGLWLAAPPLLVPGLAISLAGGALFGPFWGAVYTLGGATGGAALAFLLARYLAADWVERKAKGQLGRIKAGVEAEGWMFVAFTRLVPLFPFNLLNYAFGLTRIPLRIFVIVSLICMAPGTAAYTYLGYAGREALVGGEDLIRKGVIAVAVLAALVFIPLLLRKWHAARTSAQTETGANPKD
ncbi:MAG: TVP38/TMEM64 family protein [SAR324 cluster bacterium]|nr:TVP38/TMEM64 family protein [SAR324 cluster bacterium]